MYVGMHWSNRVGREGDAVIMGGMNLVNSVEGSLHVPGRWFIAVRCQERVNCREIRTRGRGEPTDTTDKALVGGRTSKLSRRIFVIGGRSN